MKTLNIKKLIGLAAATFGFAVAASGTTYTWVGASGGDWTAASNWSPTGQPASGDTIAFTTAVNVTANVTGETTYKLLLQHPSAEFVKAGSGTLTVSHSYGVAQGRLTVAVLAGEQNEISWAGKMRHFLTVPLGSLSSPPFRRQQA